MITVKCKSRLDEELLVEELRRRGVNVFLEAELELGEAPEELLEDSSAISISKIRNHKGGPELITHLHKVERLGHDQAWEHHDLKSAPKGSSIWSIVKQADTWLLLTGNRGTAAVRYDKTKSGFKVVASGEEVVARKIDNGPEIVRWLKSQIGELEEQYYQGIDSGKVSKLRAHRSELAKPSPKWEPNRRVANRRGPERRANERRGPNQ